MDQRALTKAAASLAWLIAAAAGGAWAYRWSAEPQVREHSEVVPDWTRYALSERTIDEERGGAVIVLFTDYQCPFCRTLEAQLDTLRSRIPEKFGTVVRHYPLERIHPQARELANAVECAGGGTTRRRVHRFLFSLQDSIIAPDWLTVARELGLPDPSSFSQCVRNRDQNEKINEDLKAAKELGLRGTPALIIDGKLFRGVGDISILEGAITTSVRRSIRQR